MAGAGPQLLLQAEAPKPHLASEIGMSGFNVGNVWGGSLHVWQHAFSLFFFLCGGEPGPFGRLRTRQIETRDSTKSNSGASVGFRGLMSAPLGVDRG